MRNAANIYAAAQFYPSGQRYISHILSTFLSFAHTHTHSAPVIQLGAINRRVTVGERESVCTRSLPLDRFRLVVVQQHTNTTEGVSHLGVHL